MRSITDYKSSSLFFKDVRKYGVITKEEEQRLFSEYYDNNTSPSRKEKIRDKIILSNLRWCVTLSKKYFVIGATQFDLLSEAYKGMILSFNKFDYTKNMRFATFASFYIKNELNSFIYNEGQVINDVTSNRTIDRLISKVVTQLEQEYGRTPSSNEIIELFNKQKDDGMATLNDFGLFNRMNKNIGVASLDESIDGESDTTLGERISYNGYNADDEIRENDRTNQIDKILSSILDEREITIIKLKYGIGTEGTEYTNEMIGNQLNLTRERIGQIADSALKKLQKRKDLIKYLV